VNPLRHLLLVAVLLFAQLAAGAHAVGHVADNEGGLPTHTCELCLAAHDLGTGLPSLAALAPIIAAAHLPDVRHHQGRSTFPPPVASQRAPPTA